MKIEPFATEQFFSLYEFTAPHPLSLSDCETISVAELLNLADVSLEEFGQLKLHYTESPGNPKLRQKISELYATASDEDIVVLTSPVEGIYLVMRTLLEPGDDVISLRPAYDALNNVVRHICGDVRPWKLEPAAGCWTLDVGRLEDMITDKTKMVVVNFPHNPTGFLPAREQFQELIEVVSRRGIWLFCDEMYRGLEYTPVERIPSAADCYERAIVLSGLSKTYGLPGLRCGWLVIRNRQIRDELINWKHYTSICPAAPTEALSTAALKTGDKLIARNLAIVRQNVRWAGDFFSKWPDLFAWRPPQGGSVAFAEIDLKRVGSASATGYCHQLATNTGVLLLPGACLGYPDRYVRFGLGRKSFAESLDVYDRHLKQTTIAS